MNAHLAFFLVFVWISSIVDSNVALRVHNDVSKTKVDFDVEFEHSGDLRKRDTDNSGVLDNDSSAVAPASPPTKLDDVPLMVEKTLKIGVVTVAVWRQTKTKLGVNYTIDLSNVKEEYFSGRRRNKLLKFTVELSFTTKREVTPIKGSDSIEVKTETKGVTRRGWFENLDPKKKYEFKIKVIYESDHQDLKEADDLSLSENVLKDIKDANRKERSIHPLIINQKLIICDINVNISVDYLQHKEDDGFKLLGNYRLDLRHTNEDYFTENQLKLRVDLILDPENKELSKIDNGDDFELEYKKLKDNPLLNRRVPFSRLVPDERYALKLRVVYYSKKPELQKPEEHTLADDVVKAIQDTNFAIRTQSTTITPEITTTVDTPTKDESDGDKIIDAGDRTTVDSETTTEEEAVTEEPLPTTDEPEVTSTADETEATTMEPETVIEEKSTKGTGVTDESKVMKTTEYSDETTEPIDVLATETDGEKTTKENEADEATTDAETEEPVTDKATKTPKKSTTEANQDETTTSEITTKSEERTTDEQILTTVDGGEITKSTDSDTLPPPTQPSTDESSESTDSADTTESSTEDITTIAVDELTTSETTEETPQIVTDESTPVSETEASNEDTSTVALTQTTPTEQTTDEIKTDSSSEVGSTSDGATTESEGTVSVPTTDQSDLPIATTPIIEPETTGNTDTTLSETTQPSTDRSSDQSTSAEPVITNIVDIASTSPDSVETVPSDATDNTVSTVDFTTDDQSSTPMESTTAAVTDEPSPTTQKVVETTITEQVTSEGTAETESTTHDQSSTPKIIVPSSTEVTKTPSTQPPSPTTEKVTETTVVSNEPSTMKPSPTTQIVVDITTESSTSSTSVITDSGSLTTEAFVNLTEPFTKDVELKIGTAKTKLLRPHPSVISFSFDLNANKLDEIMKSNSGRYRRSLQSDSDNAKQFDVTLEMVLKPRGSEPELVHPIPHVFNMNEKDHNVKGSHAFRGLDPKNKYEANLRALYHTSVAGLPDKESVIVSSDVVRDIETSNAPKANSAPPEDNGWKIAVGSVVGAAVLIIAVAVIIVRSNKRKLKHKVTTNNHMRNGSYLDNNVSTLRSGSIALKEYPKNGNGVDNDGFQDDANSRSSTLNGNHFVVTKYSLPINVSEFSTVFRSMKENNFAKICDEFKKVKQITETKIIALASQRNARITNNRLKNRFANIVPYDHSRVKLTTITDTLGADYINANYIPGFQSKKEYIATQGPLRKTLTDFWRMICEQDVSVIVNLTQSMEGDIVKCETYWPTLFENGAEANLESGASQPSLTIGAYRIVLKSETNVGDFTIRDLEVFAPQKTFVVKQFHLTQWLDFESPRNPRYLLNLIKSVRKHCDEKQLDNETKIAPILVHCSAGVGRTGTFIAVDRLYQELVCRNAPQIDVFGTVMDMRQHRVHMVQTEEQYIFIYECIAALIDDFSNGSNTTGSRKSKGSSTSM